MQLLLDEHLSPRLAEWCAERRGIYATSVTHLGLSGAGDHHIWRYAYDHDFVIVTTNARHFLRLLDVEVHPGLIILREAGLSREEQWGRLAVAIDYIQRQPHPANYMVNRVIELLAVGQLLDREIPPP